MSEARENLIVMSDAKPSVWAKRSQMAVGGLALAWGTLGLGVMGWCTSELFTKEEAERECTGGTQGAVLGLLYSVIAVTGAVLTLKGRRGHGFALLFIAEVIAMYDNVVDYGMTIWGPLFRMGLWSVPALMVTPAYLSNLIIKGGVAPVFDNPSDFELEPEDVTFQSSDGVTLRGWLFRGSGKGVIVQSHFGVQCSRCGFTPKGKGMAPLWPEDIRFLKHIKAFVDAGYSVLAYDTRNHGSSDEACDGWVSWGPTERHDVIAAVKYIASHSDYADAPIGMLSICMGLASTTYAYGEEDGLGTIDNLKAIIGVQPLLYGDFMKNVMGLPGFLNKSVDERNSERTGVDLVHTSFMPHVSKIDVPVLLVQNKNDPFPDMANVEAYYDALPREKEMLWLDLEPKRAVAYAHMTESPQFMLDFFVKHLRGPS